MKPRKGIHILPSLFTTGNVFCGFYSFIAALNDKYFLAAWAIVLAIIFDVLDGRIARMTKTTSAFGMQYDSLADVISFGMAPAISLLCLGIKAIWTCRVDGCIFILALRYITFGKIQHN